MAVEFCLLQTISAQVDGREVDLGHLRQRQVLAALLVDANRPVSVERLIDRLWGEGPPQRAATTLYSYLSRLRRVIEPLGASISRHPQGYVCEVDPQAVDLHRFRDLVARARSAGDDTHAARLLTEALRLWPGDTPAEPDTPWFNALRDTLEGERLAAELDLNDVLLRQGRESELPAPLRLLAQAHPLDERIAAQLMLALHRQGRTPQALEVYRGITRLLDAELGLAPSPSLRQLHQDILVGAPLLAVDSAGGPLADTPPGSGSGSGSASGSGPGAGSDEGHRPTPVAVPAEARFPVPRQLPSPPPVFTGRGRAMAELDRLLEPPSGHGGTVPIAGIGGSGGIGKTCLALHWAHQRLDQFPEGQLYLNLRGFEPSGTPTTVASALRDLLDSLGAPDGSVPTGLNARAGLYRSLIQGRRILVILDNARDAEQVLPLLPGSPTCVVIVTSRHHLAGLVTTHGARLLTLGPLSTADAASLLTRRLGRERVHKEPAAAAGLLQLCGGLPLAISIIAARAAVHPTFPLQGLIRDLHGAGGALDTLDAGDDSADLRAVFASSYGALSEPARRIFPLLGLLAGPDIGLAAVAALAGAEPRQVGRALTELVRAHLVTAHRPDRYTMHDLLRAYAAELAAADPASRSAFERLVDHYLHTAHAADRLLSPHGEPIALTPALPGAAPVQLADHQAALAWFAAEHAVLTSLVAQARHAELHVKTWQLAAVLPTFLARRGLWDELTATQYAGLEAATALADRSYQARAHRELGNSCCETGCFDDAQAHLEQALDLYRELGDTVGQAHTHLNLGWLWERRGDQQRGLEHDLLALDRFEAADHETGRARALNAAGWDHAQLGKYEEAADFCREALALQQHLGDRRGEANTWDSLGYALQHLGDHRQAADCFLRSLHLNEELGHQYNQAETLEHLGDTHEAGGDTAAARAAWQRAADLLHATGHHDADLHRLRGKLQNRS
ncbi:BTAD domain-containing putative transcriptional regulator [Streptomyces nigrescens]|uniref:AfsR/SARP family transcriptional regulator n=1 Tax=Streptomyces nigrescens TaxID=1920 RepID=UPI0021C49D7D|nr:BTAD domain-containing putative transcriptional regulator [Streptomyces nigrescens]